MANTGAPIPFVVDIRNGIEADKVPATGLSLLQILAAGDDANAIVAAVN